MGERSVSDLFQRLPAGRFEAGDWGRRYGDDLGEAWFACQRGDWLVWLAAILEVDPARITRAACACARFAVSLLPDERHEQHLLPVLETAERWARGEAGSQECAAAAKSVLEIYQTREAVAPDSAPTAGYATSAVSAAVNLPTFLTPYGIAAAASSAVLASAQVATPNDEAAIADALSRCAELVREHVPFEHLAASGGFRRYVERVAASDA